MSKNYGNESGIQNKYRLKYGKSEEPISHRLVYNLKQPNDCITCDRKPHSNKQLMCMATCGKNTHH